MSILTFATLVITGFTACAEFGSYAFVHPVIKRLARQDHMMVEQGLVKTFGRVMPALMTASQVLVIAYAISITQAGVAGIAAWAAAAVWAVGLTTTILVNVGINYRTARFDLDQPPEDWDRIRNRWELFQALRSWAFLVAFVLVCLTVSM